MMEIIIIYGSPISKFMQRPPLQTFYELFFFIPGSGLGQAEDGIKEAIKVQIKNDKTGVSIVLIVTVVPIN